jgi:hypothetical protein
MIKILNNFGGENIFSGKFLDYIYLALVKCHLGEGN